MKKIEASCVVIGGHPAGLMQSVFRLRRMILCCDLYDQFQQIPSGADVELSFLLVQDLETFVLALEILLFYYIMILFPYPLSLCHRPTDEEVSKNNLRSVLRVPSVYIFCIFAFIYYAYLFAYSAYFFKYYAYFQHILQTKIHILHIPLHILHIFS